MITKSRGNVFADLGFESAEAQVLAMRADLMVALEKSHQGTGADPNANGQDSWREPSQSFRSRSKEG